MSIEGGSSAIRCVASGIAVKKSGIPGVVSEGSTALLQVPMGVIVCGNPDASANAPFGAKISPFALVSGARRN